MRRLLFWSFSVFFLLVALLACLPACDNERLNRLDKENTELKKEVARKNQVVNADASGRRCVRVFINMQTILSDEEPGGKLFVSYLQDAIAKSFKTETPMTACLEYGGAVDDVNDWQMRNAPNEALIESSRETIDDDSIGVIGKRIEAIAYVSYSWENKRNRTVNLGPALITFGVGDPNHTDAIARERAMQAAGLISLFTWDARNQK